MSSPASAPAHHVDLVIKTPSSESEAPLRLSVSLDGTIRDIKEHLTKQHPEHPPPSDQRLIFAGKLLADSSRTADVLRQRDVNEPQTFHLMLPLKESSSRPSASSSAPMPTRSASAPSAPSAPSASSGPSSTSAAAATAGAATSTPPSPFTSASQSAHWSSAAGAAAFRPPSAEAEVPAPLPFTTAADVPMMMMPPHPFMTNGGMAYTWAYQEWDGQPYVFAVPYAAPFSPPLPYIHSQLGTFAITNLGEPTAGGLPLSPLLVAGLAGGHAPTNLAEDQGAENAAVAAADGAAAAAAAEQAGGGAVLAGGLGGAEAEAEVEEGRTDPVKLLLKLAFFVYVLGQDGTNQRLFLLLLGAVVIFLAQTGRLDFLHQLAAPQRPAANRRPAPAPAPPRAEGAPTGDDGSPAADGADGGVARAPAAAAADADDASLQPAPAPESAFVSLLRDIESVVSAFFTSLVPTWRPYDRAEHEQPALPAGAAAN